MKNTVPCAGKIKFTLNAILEKQANVTTEFSNTLTQFNLNTLLPWNISTDCDPQISEIFPTYGPHSGGTFLTIYGKNLNIEGEMRIHIRDAKCYFVERKAHYVSCLTSDVSKYVSSNFEGELVLEWYKYGVKQNDLTNVTFTYKMDPIIHTVQPEESILSGGILVTALGMHLDSVAEPQMVVTVVTPRGANVYYQVLKYVSQKSNGIYIIWFF